MQPSHPSSVDSFNHTPSAFVSIMVVDDEERVYHTWNPKKHAQNYIEERLNRFAAQQHSQRRKKKRYQVKHLKLAF